MRGKLWFRTLLTASILFLIGGMCSGVWLLFQEPRGERRRLPDGTTIEFLAVSTGKSHRYDPRSPFQRLQEALRPGATRGRGTGQAPGLLTWQSRDPALAFWVRWHPYPQGARTEYVLRLSDSHGCFFDSAQDRLFRFQRSGNTLEDWRAYAFSAYSRREPNLQLHVWDLRTRRSAAMFPVANPLRVAGDSSWEPDPVPLVRRAPDLEFHLKQVSLQSTPLYGTAQADYLAPDPSRPGEKWEAAAITVTDAAGNRIRADARPRSRPGRAFFPGLCREEGAWSLVFELARTVGTQAAPDYEWRFRDLPVPARSGTAYLNRTARDQGVTLQVQATARNAASVNRRGERVYHLRIGLIAAPPESLHLELREAFHRAPKALYAEAGLPYRPELQADNAQAGTPRQHSFLVPCPPNARKVDLTFVGYRNRTVACRVRPR